LYELEALVVKAYLDKKIEHDTLNQAVKLSKERGIEEKHVQKMVSRKKELKALLSEDNVVIAKKLISCDSTIARLQDGWFAIRYKNDKNEVTIMVELLLQRDIHFLELDPKRKREYRKSEIATLLPGYIDEVSLEMYKDRLKKKARQLILESTGITVFDDPVLRNDTLRVSSHAIKRWILRMLGITSEIKIDEYKKEHSPELEAEILNNVKNSKLIWENYEDSVQYWFDEKNIVYVISNNTVVTVYEEVFGFVKEVNRAIVMNQLEVIKRCHEERIRSEKEGVEIVARLSEELEDIEDQTRVLESSLELLKTKQITIAAKRDECLKYQKMIKDEFYAEFNKLFRKWEG